MKAYVFPGQGAQFVGMGKDLYENNPLAKEMFEKANEILGFRITDLMFAGTDEDLRQTKVTQPAIFLHSVILAKTLGDQFKPDMTAGHSLGEFSALVAAGALSFEDGLVLVSKRAMAMQKACEQNPSTMAAIIALPDEKVEEICASVDGVVVPANYNCPGQLVISGTNEAIDEACAKLTAAGATFPIKVQYPYNPAVVDWDKQCQVFKQQVEGVLNDGFDFINIIITQGPSDNFLNAVRRVGAYELMSYYWGADYSDPETEVYPFYQEAGDRGTCYSFLRTGVEDGIVTGETADLVMQYMSMVENAKTITEDLDARYEAFANAEAYLIQNALVVPLGLPVPPYIATRLNLWEGQYAPTGLSSNRLKGVHILDHYVSMDEYDQNRDAR